MLQPDGQPWEMPGRFDYVFAVLDSGVKGGVEHDASAAVFFGVQRVERRYVYILDWQTVELGAASLEAWFAGLVAQLHGYTETARVAYGAGPVFVEPAGLGELIIAKFPGDAVAVDSAIVQRGKDLRALGCEPFINGGQVRLTRPAFERVATLKGQRLNHLMAQLRGFRIGDKAAHRRADDVLDAVCYGVTLAFEETAYGRLRVVV